MMIGLCGAELVRPESVGASQGFLGASACAVHAVACLWRTARCPELPSTVVCMPPCSPRPTFGRTAPSAGQPCPFLPLAYPLPSCTPPDPLRPSPCSPRLSSACPPPGWVAYLGAANAGIPLSIIVKDYGWGAYFTGERRGQPLILCFVAAAAAALQEQWQL